MIERMKSLEEVTVVLAQSDWYWYSQGAFERFATGLTSITDAKVVFVIEGDDDEKASERGVEV